MTLKTRGSLPLDKAQRRLANLKSIDANLNLGHGLTLEAYIQHIEATRAALNAHNTLVSSVAASRHNLNELEKTLSELSERMLLGVATKYGRASIQYSQAGGSVRKGNRSSTNTVVGLPLPVNADVTASEAIAAYGQIN